jgi:hypothetical protein
MTAWIYRLHRWLALLFALPLAIVIVSGLILSFEPAFTTGAIKPGSLSADGLVALIKKHDPQGSARRIDIRPYDNTMSILLDRRSERRARCTSRCSSTSRA